MRQSRANGVTLTQYVQSLGRGIRFIIGKSVVITIIVIEKGA